jgi:hypothetical protein
LQNKIVGSVRFVLKEIFLAIFNIPKMPKELK